MVKDRRVKKMHSGAKWAWVRSPTLPLIGKLFKSQRLSFLICKMGLMIEKIPLCCEN